MSAKKRTDSIPPEQLALYERLVAATPGAELKANFGFPYTAVNGNMYSLISKTGSVGIRLPADERAAFLARFQTTTYEHMPGAPLKEYVTVPDALLADTETLKDVLAISLRYTATLKPKATKKKS